jgi:ceramide glucosyltransferase
MATILPWLALVGYALSAVAMGYGVIALLTWRRPSSVAAAPVSETPPVTLLKPLCGEEPETYECLRSFCHQDYPQFQIIFGVPDEGDPALAIARRLKREFPHRDLRIVLEGRQHGSNRKVSNLINMMPHARHDYLVLSDSDIRVRPDYLRRVVAPLLDDGVGIVTCAYRGVARKGLWSLLGSMYINEWFMPSVRVAALAGTRSFAFGATIAIRRCVLARIGGFPCIVNQLADDYRLGEATRRLGLRTVLSDVEVDTYVTESSFRELIRHEVRWLRTIRALRPSGYSLSFITFGVPLTALQALLMDGSAPAVTLFAITLGARLLLHLKARPPGRPVSHLLAFPVRDVLSLGLWSWSFAANFVVWRGDRYRVTADGSFQFVERV